MLSFLLAYLSAPKLAVVVVFDQFRYDYIERFSPYFVKGGFKRLIKGGASFKNCHHTHVPTFTAVGHATISTGTTPRFHGIIGNYWYDRRTSKFVYAVKDTAVEMVGGNGYGASPRNLLTNTVGDELKLKTGFKGKVVSLSLKDRAAILMGGHLANIAVWFSSRDGKFVTSTYYTDRTPKWLESFNSKRPADRYFHKVWEKVGPKEAYSTSLSGEFPHVVGKDSERPDEKFYEDLKASPFGDEMLLELVKFALEGEKLGKDSFPDILFISFSSNDYVGHRYGPYSEEVADMVLRSDRLIAELLNFLDKKVGKGNYVLLLTSDHGVAPTPGRIEGLNGRKISLDSLKIAVEGALTERYGKGKWVLQASYPWFYLNDSLISQRGDPKEAREIAKEVLEKFDGIRVFTREDIEMRSFTYMDRVAEYVYNGFNPSRAGDLAVIPEPFNLMGSKYVSTNHGSPYTYDTHVPLIFYGFGVPKGKEFSIFCSTTSIAPTLARILGVEQPASSVGTLLPLR